MHYNSQTVCCTLRQKFSHKFNIFFHAIKPTTGTPIKTVNNYKHTLAA